MGLQKFYLNFPLGSFSLSFSSEEIDFVFDHFVFSFFFQKMELDFDVSNLVEDEAAEVEHNVSVNLYFLGYFSFV